jgi:hypothetical protein
VDNIKLDFRETELSGSSEVAERLAASQQGLSSMKLVNYAGRLENYNIVKRRTFWTLGE